MSILLLTESIHPSEEVVFNLNTKLLSIPVWLSGKLKDGFFIVSVLVIVELYIMLHFQLAIVGVAGVVLVGLIVAGAHEFVAIEKAGFGFG